MTERERPDPLAMIAKMEEEEKKLSQTTFLAPIVAGGRVRVRVAGIVYEMKVRTRETGFCILRMVEQGVAEVVETASLSLVAKYLALFPRVRLVLVDQLDKTWWALAYSEADSRLRLSGPVPVRLVLGCTNFDTIHARFDGATFWFDSVDRKRDPAVSRTLRRSLEADTKPADLRARGMVPSERLAYRMMYLHKHRNDPAETMLDDRTRISEALRHAGATLDSFRYTDQNQQYATVRFEMDGQDHVVNVSVGDLTLQSAGVCLSGQDQDFDLTSVVGVLREAAGGWYDYRG